MIIHTLYKRVRQGVEMKGYIEERVMQLSEYIIQNGSTVRQTADVFGVSKSTAHQDLTVRICQMNPMVARKVRKVLDLNKAERHIRGGMATKAKYENEK